MSLPGLYKIWASYKPTADIENFVGSPGELFYNFDEQKIRISDGATLGGIIIATGDGSGTSLKLSTVDSNNTVINEFLNVSSIKFDDKFNLTGLLSSEVKIDVDLSTFKFWEVEGQNTLVSSGVDTVKIVAGDNMTITTDSDTNSIVFNTVAQVLVNADGGTPSTIYGGISPIDGGNV